MVRLVSVVCAAAVGVSIASPKPTTAQGRSSEVQLDARRAAGPGRPVDRAKASEPHPAVCPLSDRTISREDVEDLERQVLAAPDDLELRSQLLRHYFLDTSPAGRAARARHALWIIAHAPESDISGSPYAEFDPARDSDAYQQARALWLRHLEAHGEEATIIGNAARFFLYHEQGFGTALLRRAVELEPSNQRWKERLATVQLEPRDSTGMSDQATAKSALPQFEATLKQNANGKNQSYFLLRAAEAAFRAGEDVKAHEYATALVRLADDPAMSSTYGDTRGDAIHEGHRILGQLAIRTGDIESAKAQLLMAGATPGSPQLNSFGPVLTLAQDLLARGERATVIEYLELCSRFWKGRTEALEEWIALIRDGKTPELNRFRARRSKP